MDTESNLRKALEVVPNGIVIIDSKGIMKYVNPGTRQMFGYMPGELVNHNVSILMPRDHADNHDGYINRYLETNEARIIGIGREVLARKKDGSLFPVYLSVGEIKGDNGINFIGVMTDLTRLKETEKNLKLTEERSTLAQRFANIGYWDWTITTGDLFWSERIAPMFGYQAGELETSYENFLGAIHPEDRARVAEAVNNSVHNGAEYEIEHRVVWPDGTIRWLLERGDIIRSADGKPLRMLGVVQDITARKKLEADLVKARDEAEAGAKAKSSFLANMSHEIRTPMNSIIGFVEIAMADKSIPENVLSYLKTARDASRNLLSLLNEILDVSKLEAGKVEVVTEKFYLPALLKDVMNSLKVRSDEKAIELRLDIDPALFVCIESDPARIRQILVNLIGNSIKFSEKGTIAVRALNSFEYPGQIEFSVKDDGIGMTNEQISRIFNPFTQADESTSRKFGGTGLGTTICKQLVELLGGKIWVHSKPQKGTTVYFSIPFKIPVCADNCSEDCDIYQTERELQVPHLNQTYNILLAEDIPENARLVKIRLENEGCRVDIAYNGKDAVELFRKNQYDIILMDVHMPIMDGEDATREIRSLEGEGRRTPIIAITASVMIEEKRKYLETGMDEVLAKPVNFSELFTMIQKYGSSKSPGNLSSKPVPLGETSIVNWPPPPPGIDIKKGIQRWQDPDSYLLSLEGFLKDYENVAAILAEYIQTDVQTETNIRKAIELSHKLKGVSGNLSLHGLFELYTRINNNLVSGDTIGARTQLEKLSSLMKESSEYIRLLLQTTSKAAPLKKYGMKQAGKIDREKMRREIDLCLSLCKRGDVTGEAWSSLLSDIEQMDIENLAQDIRNSLRNFDFQKAEEILIHIKKEIL